ncbi:uracil-DNA glycosylase [Maridesulfovibrio zosterae]|uniref:uracil-DNA glycosylase n=1 Tax=Maridesulfovibrio zosterae TaxID=82171 RepID=UPI0003F57E7A|nr:uracil-DNA glycosylase [Maridesulfovibrio zosterae]
MKVKFCDSTYKMHESWADFFSIQKLDELESIGKSIGHDFTPSAERVLRFCEVDLKKIEVIILGQDPYPQPGVATGRSFEVGNIDKWSDLKRNASLVNILKLLHKNYLQAEETVGIAKIRDDINSGHFPILPPNKFFDDLEQQGVLFLNAALTCRIMNSGSHTDIWRDFSTDLLKFISAKNNALWFLWGKDAQEFCSFVPESNKLTSYHPRLFDKKPGAFLHENHFAKCKKINWVK